MGTGCVPAGQTKGRVWLCPALACSPLAARGIIFLYFYFCCVPLPEPGLPSYHTDTLIKDKPLAAFFRAVSMYL